MPQRQRRVRERWLRVGENCGFCELKVASCLPEVKIVG